MKVGGNVIALTVHLENYCSSHVGRWSQRVFLIQNASAAPNATMLSCQRACPGEQGRFTVIVIAPCVGIFSAELLTRGLWG
jgi:hypothetical protein